jgi:hypothetical protein
MTVGSRHPGMNGIGEGWSQIVEKIVCSPEFEPPYVDPESQPSFPRNHSSHLNTLDSFNSFNIASFDTFDFHPLSS